MNNYREYYGWWENKVQMVLVRSIKFNDSEEEIMKLEWRKVQKGLGVVLIKLRERDEEERGRELGVVLNVQGVAYILWMCYYRYWRS